MGMPEELPPGIPPVPEKWDKGVAAWIAHRQKGNNSVKKYYDQMDSENRPIHVDDQRTPTAQLIIDSNSGLLTQAAVTPEQKLFKAKP